MAIETQCYMVFVSGREGPKCQHATEAEAIGEAKRLASRSDNIGRRVYWLKAVGYVEARVEVEEHRLLPAEGAER